MKEWSCKKCGQIIPKGEGAIECAKHRPKNWQPSSKAKKMTPYYLSFKFGQCKYCGVKCLVRVCSNCKAGNSRKNAPIYPGNKD